MDTHLDLVATIGLHFTQLVHQVQPGTFRRHIHDTVPHVHAVLDKLSADDAQADDAAETTADTAEADAE